MDDKKLFATDGLYLFSLRGGIKIKENYVLGILNSKFITFLYRLLALEKGRVLAQVKPTILQKLPIHPIDLIRDILQFPIPLPDKARHDRMVQLVETMLDLHRRLQRSRLPEEKTQLQRRITATDHRIDQLVYDLYGLTEEEIRIVEEAT